MSWNNIILSSQRFSLYGCDTQVFLSPSGPFGSARCLQALPVFVSSKDRREHNASEGRGANTAFNQPTSHCVDFSFLYILDSNVNLVHLFLTAFSFRNSQLRPSTQTGKIQKRSLSTSFCLPTPHRNYLYHCRLITFHTLPLIASIYIGVVQKTKGAVLQMSLKLPYYYETGKDVSAQNGRDSQTATADSCDLLTE